MRLKQLLACLVALSLALSCMATNVLAEGDDFASQTPPSSSEIIPDEDEDEGLKNKQEEANTDTSNEDEGDGNQTIGDQTGGDQAGDSNENPSGGDQTGGNQEGGGNADSGQDSDKNSDGSDSEGGGNQNNQGDSGNSGDNPSGDSEGNKGSQEDVPSGNGSNSNSSGGVSGGTSGGEPSDNGNDSGDYSIPVKQDGQTKQNEEHGEIAGAKADGTWGQEYTTCEKCGKHDWWKLSDGTFVCKNCGFNTTGVKETSNVEVWEGGTDLVVLSAVKNAESTGSQSGKGTLNVSIPSEGGIDVGQTITKTVSASDENPIQVKDSKESQFIKINLEETLSLNPVQAEADKRELAYLNSVLAYQKAVAEKEQQYIESVQQQQLVVVQREAVYTEMVLTAAAQLQREAVQREAAYLRSVRAAQAAAGKSVNPSLSPEQSQQNKTITVGHQRDTENPEQIGSYSFSMPSKDIRVTTGSN